MSFSTRRVVRSARSDRTGRPRREATAGRMRRRSCAVGLAGLGLVLAGFVGAAFACIPQPLLSTEPRSSGPAGSEITVKVQDVTGSTAEIRWNSVEGPVLAKGSGRDFSASVKIPESDEGLYALVLVGRMVDGTVGSTGRAAFFVTSSGGTATRAQGKEAARVEDEVGLAPEPASDGGSGAAGVFVGAGLLAGGAAGGALFARRRTRVNPVTAATPDAEGT